MTTETAKLTPYHEKRKALRALSANAKELQETEFPDLKINEIIIEQFYKTAEHTEFHTLMEWNRKGFTVNKGESSFVIWGKPKAVQNKEKNPEAEEDDENEFFPLCYLFSNAQVKARDAKK